MDIVFEGGVILAGGLRMSALHMLLQQVPPILYWVGMQGKQAAGLT